MARAIRTNVGSRPATRAKHPARKDSSPRRVPIDAIDWSYAIRSIKADHVDRLAGAAHLPPIKVWEFQPGQYRGIDGYHRWSLAKSRGDSRVETFVRRLPKGSDGEKAFEFECVQSNMQHGLPLTREERDRAIVRIWNRWGSNGTRSSGETLESLGKLFNLTKQRIHQVLTASVGPAPGSAHAVYSADDHGPSGRAPRLPSGGGRFSTFGRFTAAARRLARLLGDTDFVSELCRQHQSDLVKELLQLRNLVDDLIDARSR